MVFAQGDQEWFHTTRPGEGAACFQIVRIKIVIKSLYFKWIVAVGDIMALAVHSAQEIEKSVKYPVQNKQHFDLLPKMNLFVANKLGLIIWFAGYPDENEKR